MKKTYVKPRAVMEYFTLSQSIANGCGWNSEDYYGRPTHDSPSTCTWEEAGGDIYWTQTASCPTVVPDDFELGEGCYNAPSGTNQIFAS